MVSVDRELLLEAIVPDAMWAGGPAETALSYVADEIEAIEALEQIITNDDDTQPADMRYRLRLRASATARLLAFMDGAKPTEQDAPASAQREAPEQVPYDPDRITEYVMRARDHVDRMTSAFVVSDDDAVDGQSTSAKQRFVTAARGATGTLDQIRDAMTSARKKARARAQHPSQDAPMCLGIIEDIESHLALVLKELVHLTSVDRDNGQARDALVTLIATTRDIECAIGDLKGRFDAGAADGEDGAAS